MTIPLKIKVLILTFWFGSCLISVPSVYAKEKSARSKVIDFEGDLIEGVNKLPLDSVNQLSEANKNKDKPHLYKKRKAFSSENLYKISVLRYIK